MNMDEIQINPEDVLRLMEEDKVKKLWHVCDLLHDFCESHYRCEFCPFHSEFEGCKIKDAAGVSVDNLWQLFPESLDTEGD